MGRRTCPRAGSLLAADTDTAAPAAAIVDGDPATPRQWHVAGEVRARGAAGRVRLRCEITGRPRGNYRKFKLSRNMLRELGSKGQLPGMVKASW